MAESQSPNIQPIALKRELRSVLHLFKDDNFEGITTEEGFKLNMTKILTWFAPAMADYCSLLHMTNCRRSSRPILKTAVKAADGASCRKSDLVCEAKKICVEKRMDNRKRSKRIAELECNCKGTAGT